MKKLTLALLLTQTITGATYELSKDFSEYNNTDSLKGGPLIVTVGSDNQCDYSTIQQAIDNSDEVRIATNGSPYFEHLTLSADDASIIKGGYANCSDASINITDLSRPIIDAGGNSNDVIEIRFNDEATISNLIIGNGRYGVWLPSSELTTTIAHINNLTVFNNERGIVISGDSNKALIKDSTINFNSNGGVRCSGDNELFIYGNSLIEGNTKAKGGGVNAAYDCQASVLSPTIIDNNSATDGGGGIYAESGADIYLLSGSFTCNGLSCGSNTETITISNNNGDSDNNSSGNGGGVLVEDNGSSVIAFNALFSNNQAHYGGAVSTNLNGSFYASSFYNGENECWSLSSCSQFEKNKATLGGVVHAHGTSTVTIATSRFKNNRANSGIISYMFQTPEVKLNNNMIFKNGNSGIGDYQDSNLFDNDGGNLIIEYQTIADNNITNEVLQGFESTSSIRSSIIHESVDVYDEQQNSSAQFECLIVNETSSFSAGGTVVVDTPLFANSANDDYRNQPMSPAIDFCYDINSSGNTDVDNNLHGVDYMNKDNLHGTFDLGADEFVIANDIIFKNGLEID